MLVHKPLLLEKRYHSFAGRLEKGQGGQQILSL
jgi:hypothetical protein